MPTEIKRCGYCESNKIEHEFQDTKYGKYVRVFNLKESGKGTFIVNKIMDNVEYKQNGNRSIVRMIKKI